MRSESKDPTLEIEHEYFAQGYPTVIGLDEVGRGAIAGPVAVGAHLVTAGTESFPMGLRDSKLLSEKRREALSPLVTAWGSGAVGFSTAKQIDEHGIIWGLGAAARDALLQLHDQGVAVNEALIILDGSHDWLSPVLRSPLTVITRVGGDRECASVAAASIRAKVARDEIMRAAHETHPQYAWASNKGYGSAAHYAGIEEFGVTAVHRSTWIRSGNTKGKLKK